MFKPCGYLNGGSRYNTCCPIKRYLPGDHRDKGLNKYAFIV